MTRKKPGYARHGGFVRFFTPEEDEQLETMRVVGMSLRAIATKLGRPHSSVQMRLRALAEDKSDDEW